MKTPKKEKKKSKNENEFKKEGNLITINAPDGKSADGGDEERRVVCMYACMYVCR